ncbi:MAG: hypothetical protein HYS53_00970 [Candidatus Aenigmarchaeota archaeon]|nr:hypothetical protein [Candidatus Aenigmarchaeota archaeon]
MAEKLTTSGKKRLFIRYIAPRISSDMETVYNAVREPNQIVLISTKRLRRIDALMLKRMLLKLQRVVETSDRLVFTIEPDLYITVPKTAKSQSKELSEEEKRMLDEFEKIEMEEEMEDTKKKQGSYKKKLEDFIKSRGSEREPLNFEVKKQGSRIKEAMVSIKSPLSATDVGDRMAELMELKSLVSGHVPAKVKTQIAHKIETAWHNEEAVREDLMRRRRKMLRKLEAINDLVESSQISKELFARIKRQLSEELAKIDDVVVSVGSKGLSIVNRKPGKNRKIERRKGKR